MTGTVFVILPAVSFRLVAPMLLPVIDIAPILASFYYILNGYCLMVAMVLSVISAVYSCEAPSGPTSTDSVPDSPTLRVRLSGVTAMVFGVGAPTLATV